MKTTWKCLTLAAMMAAGTAQANLIVNGDFEAPELTGTSWQVYSSIPGWDKTAGAGIEIQRNTVVAAQSGNQYVELDSHYGTHTNSTMSQVVNTTAGDLYTLSFWYRPRTDNGHNDNGINVLWDVFGGDLGTFVASNEVLNLEDYRRSTHNGWMNFTLDLLASANQMVLSFQADGKDNTLGGFIDNVSLVAKVPEPGSLALLGLGLATLGLRRKAS
ncbi:DUF642 domain-containing protein [Hahella sp. SMD15-11]|uniref:DUF642 domain-containing protein n=1 Tax=Thermohahella caldifontis TaxID=3142973 RepID=A0AB39UTU0_9GAMM